MNLLLAALLLASIYCLIPGRVSEPWRTRILVLLVLLGASLGTFQFLFSKRHDAGVYSTDFPTSVGYVLGRQLRDDSDKKGDVIVVVEEPVGWATDCQVDGLKRALNGSGLNVCEPIPMGSEADTMEMPSGALERIVSKKPEAVAIVTFVGLPELTGEQDTSKLPPIYVFQAGNTSLCIPWIKSGLAKAACFYRPDVQWDVVPARISSLESAFNDRFRLVTRDSLSATGADPK